MIEKPCDEDLDAKAVAAAATTRPPPPTSKTGVWHMSVRESHLPTDLPKLPGERHEIIVGDAVGAAHNPSIVMHRGQLMCCVRVLNGKKTTNWLGYLDDKWKLRDAKAVRVSKEAGLSVPELIYPGAEDCRLFSVAGVLHAIAAVHDGHASSIRQALIEFVLADGGRSEHLIDWAQTQSGVRHEKNWMPAIDTKNERIRFVYSVDPLVVLDLYDAEHVTPSAVDVPQSMGLVRGGTQLVQLAGGDWLSLVHEVYRPTRPDPTHNPLMWEWAPIVKDPRTHKPIVYVHRFARYDAAIKRVALGPPFYLTELGIEFAAGLHIESAGSFTVGVEASAFDTWATRLIISYGLEDKQAMLAVVDADEAAPFIPRPFK